MAMALPVVAPGVVNLSFVIEPATGVEPPVTVYVNVLDVTPVTNTEVGVPPYNEPAVVPPLALIVPLDADTDEFKLMLLVVHEPGPLNVTVAFQGPVPDMLPTVAIVGIIE